VSPLRPALPPSRSIPPTPSTSSHPQYPPYAQHFFPPAVSPLRPALLTSTVLLFPTPTVSHRLLALFPPHIKHPF
jgi:hypothetical protein